MRVDPNPILLVTLENVDTETGMHPGKQHKDTQGRDSCVVGAMQLQAKECQGCPQHQRLAEARNDSPWGRQRKLGLSFVRQ